MKLVKAVASEKTNEEAVYLFNSADGNGFMVLSADDRFPAVLGYSETGSVSNSDENPAFAAWIEQYAAYIGSAEAPEIADGAEGTPKAAISPMIETKWAQRAPFYNLTPIDQSTNKQSLSGCVATALSQIMYYHKYPAVGTGTISYSYTYTSGSTSYTQPMEGDLSTMPFDWNNMIPDYTGEYTTEQGDAVATLMYACGLAVNATYRSSTTGAKTIKDVTALCENFGYSKDIKYYYRNYTRSTEEWIDLLYNSLASGWPVIYRGGSDSGGHSFICDGYDGEGLFHINWGWAGLSDGYFSLETLNPSDQGDGSEEGGYNQGQMMITNIHPPVEGETCEYQTGIMGFKGDLCFGTYVKGSTTKDNIFYVDNYGTMAGFYNKSPYPITFTKGILAIDSEGNEYPILYSSQDTKAYNSGFAYYRPGGMTKIPEGTYTIYAAYKLDGEDFTRKMLHENGYLDHLTMTVKDGSYTITKPVIPLVVTAFNVIGPAYTGSTRNAEITLTNLDPLYNYYGDIIIDIAPEGGETVKELTFKTLVYIDETYTDTPSLDFTDVPAGNYIVTFYYPTGEQISNTSFRLEVTEGSDDTAEETLTMTKCVMNNVYEPHTNLTPIKVTVQNGGTETMTLAQLELHLFNANNPSESIYDFAADVNASISKGRTKTVTLTPKMPEEVLNKFVRGDYFIRLKYNTNSEEDPVWFTTRNYFKAEYSVDEITLDNKTLTIATEKSENLTATMNPNPAFKLVEGEEFALTWHSSDPQVAEVDANGKVTGISEGEADIYVMAPNGTFATCHVTVKSSESAIDTTFANDGLKLAADMNGFKVSGVTGITVVSVYAITGFQVMPTMTVNEDVKVSIDALAPGMYIVTAASEGKTAHLKLIKR